MQLWDGSLQQMCFHGCFGSRRSSYLSAYGFIMIHMDHADCWKLHFNPDHSMILRFNWCNKTRFMQMLLIQVWKSLFWGEIREDWGRSILHLRLKLKAGWKTFASRFVLSNIAMTAMLLLSLASTLFNCVLAAHGFDTCQAPIYTISPSFSYGSNLVQLVFFPKDGEHELCWIIFGLLFQRTNPSLSMRSKDNNWTVAVTGMKDANNCVRVTSIEDLGANLATPDTSTCLSATNMCLVNLWISNLIFFSLLDVVDKWVARLWTDMMHKTPSLNTQLWLPQFTSLTSHVSAKLCEVRRQLQLRSSKGFKTSHFQWLHLWQQLCILRHSNWSSHGLSLKICKNHVFKSFKSLHMHRKHVMPCVDRLLPGPNRTVCATTTL